MPTLNIWRGDAQAIAQVVTVTVANVEATDEFTLTINRKDITVSGADADAVYAAFKLAISDQDAPAEFKEVTATIETVLVLTGPDDGTPFDISGSASGDSQTGGTVTITTTRQGVAAKNEIQRVTHSGTGGTFTLSFDGSVTGAIAWNAAAADVQTALEALGNIAPGDVTVTGNAGGPWSIEFEQAYAATDVPILVGDGSSLTGASSVAITRNTGGLTGVNHIYTLAWISDFDPTTTPAGIYDFTFTNPSTGVATPISLDISYSIGEIQDAFDAALGAGNTVVRFHDESLISVSVTDSAYDIEFLSLLGQMDLDNGDTYSDTTVSGSGLEADVIAPATHKPSFGMFDPVAGDLFYLRPHTTGSATGQNEKQLVKFSGSSPTGGTFRLTFRGQQTAAIDYNASNATVKTELEALSTIDGVTVTTPTGGGWLVEFTDPGTESLPLMVLSANSLTGGTVSISVSQNSQAGVNEIQKITLGSNVNGGTFKLTFDGQQTGDIDWDGAYTDVRDALVALSNIASGDIAVTEAGARNWTVTFKQAYVSTNVPQMTGDGANLTIGGSSDAVNIYIDTLPTGPEWFDEPDNWSAGTKPADAETLIFENSSRSVKYGIKYSYRYGGVISSISAAAAAVVTTTADHNLVTGRTVKLHGTNSTPNIDGDQEVTVLSATTFSVPITTSVAGDQGRWGAYLKYINPDEIRVEATFRGQIGLPIEQGKYIEYRPQRLAIGSDADTYGVMVVGIGYGDGPGSDLLRFDFSDCTVELTCWLTGNGSQPNFPALDLAGMNAAGTELLFYGGNIGIGVLEDDTAAFDSLQISSENVGSNVTLRIGNVTGGVTCGTIYNNGGSIICESALPEQVVQIGGEFTLDGAGAAVTLEIMGGDFNYNSAGTLTDALTSGDGKLIFDGDLRTKTVTNPIEVYTTIDSVVDTNKVVTNLRLDCNRLEVGKLGKHVRITRGTPA